MSGVLVDTATMLDLVLYCQPSKGRARSISSSAGAAVEALVLYATPVVEGPSFAGLTDSPRMTRYLEYYCDNLSTVPGQVRNLGSLCTRLDVPRPVMIAAHAQVLDLIERALASIENPDDIRAYDLYDYLPYHLGEDPTAIECHITGRSVANLEDLIGEFSEDLALLLSRFCALLRELNHPTRAAWILPLLRMVYYEVLQVSNDLHYAPHATKATMRFGRPEESVRSRRLLDYCRPEFRKCYLRHEAERFGGRGVSFPVPNIAVPILSRPVSWDDLLRRIASVRASDEAGQYREALAKYLDALSCGLDFEEWSGRLADVELAELRWRRRLPGPPAERRVAISSPLFFTEHGPGPIGGPLTLVHPLLPGC